MPVRFFVGPGVFDRHQRGAGAGRCRKPDEMLSIGMEPNEHDVWKWAQSATASKKSDI